MKLAPGIESEIRSLRSEGHANFYIYDLSAMRGKVEHLKQILPESVQIFYAMKANPHPVFLQAARVSGVAGIEIASKGEAESAVREGFSGSELIYTGPGKTREELEWSVKNSVKTIHIESLLEAHRLQSVCVALDKTQDVLLRVNANFDIHDAQTTFSGGSKKFGVDEEKVDHVVGEILKLDRLGFRGLHVFAASGVLNVSDLLANCKLVFDMATRLESKFSDVRCDCIDFGGGFGIDYCETGIDFDPAAYASGLASMIQKYGFSNRVFFLELGRYLAADSGWYCTEIIDIKDSRGKKQVICAGGINHFRRPAALSINHPVMIVPMDVPALFPEQESVSNEGTYIGGPLCTGADKLANDVFLTEARVGDMAVFGYAGAYGLSMSNIEFLSHDRPIEHIIKE